MRALDKVIEALGWALTWIKSVTKSYPEWSLFAASGPAPSTTYPIQTRCIKQLEARVTHRACPEAYRPTIRHAQGLDGIDAFRDLVVAVLLSGR